MLLAKVQKLSRIAPGLLQKPACPANAKIDRRIKGNGGHPAVHRIGPNRIPISLTVDASLVLRITRDAVKIDIGVGAAADPHHGGATSINRVAALELKRALERVFKRRPAALRVPGARIKAAAISARGAIVVEMQDAAIVSHRSARMQTTGLLRAQADLGGPVADAVLVDRQAVV